MSGAIEMRPADGTRLEVRSCDASFVATKTITVSNEYGKDETLKAGVTFVHDARHFLVTTYPHLFQREGARATARAAQSQQRRPRGHRSANTPAPAESTKRPMWKPLVRLNTAAAPTFTVAYRSAPTAAWATRHTRTRPGGDGRRPVRRPGLRP